MKIYNIEIDSVIIPIDVFDIRELGFIIYPSKKKESTIPLKQECNLLGVIFIDNNINFQDTSVDLLTIKLIRFFNLIFQDYRSIEWLKINTQLKKISEDNFHEVKDLNTFIQNLKEPDYKKIKGGYKVDLNNFDYPFSYPVINIDFKKLLIQYFKLNDKTPLKNKIDFFGLQSSLNLLIGRFYNNDNLERSLQFMILEHIIDESITSTKVDKKCQFCGEAIPGNKGIRRKIREFFDHFNIVELNEESKKNLTDSLINMANIRHGFFHAGSHYTRDEFDNLVSDKYGGSYTLQQEISDKNPRAIAPLLFRTLIQLILIDQLEKFE